MKVVGIIPARGGSKGIPYKNSKKLAGKPLIQYAIETALQSSKLDKVIFSSEDESLINIARSLGVEIPFVRPKVLAFDNVGSLEVIQHALLELSKMGEEFDAVCILQPTSPFRNEKDIDDAISKFENSNSDSLISVVEVPHEYNPHWVFFKTESDKLKLAVEVDNIIRRRQDLPKSFIRDGNIYITKTDVVLKSNSLYGTNIDYILSDPTRNINLDLPSDWEKAEKMAKTLVR